VREDRRVTADAALFEGLDEIRWGEMTTAYGTAEDVPGILGALVDADPATRAMARHRFEGEVHHQLGVYESTVAAVPFLLRMAERPGRPGRAGVVALPASVGRAGEPAATRLVAGAYPLWVRLLRDADSSVREAACSALLVCTDRPEEVAGVLLDRLAVETDPRVLRSIGRAATTMPAAGLPGRLRQLAGRTDDPVRRLTLVTALVELSPGGWSASELAPLLRAARRSAPAPSGRPGGPHAGRRARAGRSDGRVAGRRVVRSVR
jgi:hypothetical protein